MFLVTRSPLAPQFEEEDIDRGEAEELVTDAVSKPTPAVAEEEMMHYHTSPNWQRSNEI